MGKFFPGTIVFISKIDQSINSSSKFGKVSHYITKNGATIKNEREVYISLASNNLIMSGGKKYFDDGKEYVNDKGMRIKTRYDGIEYEF